MIKKMLWTHGLKATLPRVAILEIFNTAKRPLAAQEIIDAMGDGRGRRRAKKINQTTVYRTIKALKECGVITQIDLRHNHAHYEMAAAKKHHHLVCLQCGRIEDVYKCGIEETQAAVLRSSRHFAKIKEHALEFYGVCKKCAAKSAAAKPSSA